MKARKPHWNLTDVQWLAANGRLYLTKTKAQHSFPDAVTAMETATLLIAGLTESQFAETLVQQDTCDVYGVQVGKRGWYLKLTVDELVIVVSLHPLQ